MTPYKITEGVNELDILSFIIKLRPEQTGREGSQRLLRGYITHVSSGERRYIKNVEDITDFIIPYLEKMQVKLGLAWRIRRWRQNFWRCVLR